MMGGASAGDWNCPNCEAMVFASKNACYKCHTPKPQGAGGYDQGSFFSFGVGSPVLQTTHFATCLSKLGVDRSKRTYIYMNTGHI